MVIAFKAWPGLGSKCGRAASDDGQPRGGVGGQDQHPVRRVPPEEDVREEGVGGGCVWSTNSNDERGFRGHAQLLAGARRLQSQQCIRYEG
jgi:hypothetical protein